MYKKNMDRDKYQRDEHRVHLLVSHLIWCPPRRKPIFVGKLKERCQQLIEEQWREKGWLMLE
jgi:putative transposase